MTSSARRSAGWLKGGLALSSAVLLFACQPSAAVKPKALSEREIINADVSAFEAQLQNQKGVHQFFDPVLAAKDNAFSWQPTGRSSNEIMFKLRYSSLSVNERGHFLARCLVALSSLNSKVVVANTPKQSGSEQLGTVLTPASELLDELRYSEVAPAAVKLARRTISFYLTLPAKGIDATHPGRPASRSELATYDQLRKDWADYAKHFLDK